MYQLLIYYFHKYRHTHFFLKKLTRAQGNLIQVRYQTEKNTSTTYIKKLKKKIVQEKNDACHSTVWCRILRLDKKHKIRNSRVG